MDLGVKSLAYLLPVVAWLGYYLYFRFSGRARAEQEWLRSRPTDGADGAVGAVANQRKVVSFLAVAAVAGPLLFLGLRWLARIQETRNPAVEIHRAELIETARVVAACPKENLAVIPESHQRARVAACGQTLTFIWAQKWRRSGAWAWRQIDPTCTVNYLGFNFPCD